MWYYHMGSIDWLYGIILIPWPQKKATVGNVMPWLFDSNCKIWHFKFHIGGIGLGCHACKAVISSYSKVRSGRYSFTKEIQLQRKAMTSHKFHVNPRPRSNESHQIGDSWRLVLNALINWDGHRLQKTWTTQPPLHTGLCRKRNSTLAYFLQ